MASVTYNAQSFAIDGRRTWIVGASLDYARIDPAEWADRIADVQQAGFNTILTHCPWMLHEPRKGRFHFEDEADVAGFLRLCGGAGLRVVLRIGPFVGSGYDGGGIPGWLAEEADTALREANPNFTARVAKYLRKVVGAVSDLQVSGGGPLLLVQAEHGWNCSNAVQVEKYLDEIARMLRENGITVPIISANDLWPESTATIETWRGRRHLLRDLRQLHAVQGQAPRVVSAFNAASTVCWDDEATDDDDASTLLRAFAEVLAAGGQPIVCPFHGGTSFAFTGGQLPGRPGLSVMSNPNPAAPLGVGGARSETYHALRRLARFANDFGHVFAELDPQYQPITLDPEPVVKSTKSRSGEAAFSIVPLRGAGGRVVFVFAQGAQRQATLLLDNGLRMPIDLGDQSVGWFTLDVDLHGRGRMDYANLSPVAIVNRSIVVLQGMAKAPVFISIGGKPLQETVPSGRKPLVLSHQGVTLVICNQQQIDATYFNDHSVYVGIAGFDADGDPISAPGFATATVIDSGGESKSQKIPSARSSKNGGITALKSWSAAPTTAQVTGTLPRYASLAGPQTLAECGAATGYGWYKLDLKVGSTKKRLVHMPHAADRVHLFIDGKPDRLLGVGAAATSGPFELRLDKGQRTIVALVDNLGRLSDGTEVQPQRGLFGHLYEVKHLKTVKPRQVTGQPVDPFVLRGFIHGQTHGQLSDADQVEWAITHARKTPILIDVDGASASGTFLLNDEPIAYYPGTTGRGLMRISLDPSECEPFKRGNNTLRFAPDPYQDKPQVNIMKHTALYECLDAISKSATWSFAKWDCPAESAFKPQTAARAKDLRGLPCWWRSDFTVETGNVPIWLDTTGLSKGQVYINGRELGRYFTSEPGGRAVGPQRWLYVPRSWLNSGEPNQIVLFDEHGFDPLKLRLVESVAGDLESGN